MERVRPSINVRKAFGFSTTRLELLSVHFPLGFWPNGIAKQDLCPVFGSPNIRLYIKEPVFLKLN